MGCYTYQTLDISITYGCTVTPPGRIFVSTLLSPTTCPKGEATRSQYDSCEACINGKYQEFQIATSNGCKSCESGQASFDSNTACVICPAGKIKTVGNVYSSAACTDCQQGLTSDASGIDCNACPIGKFALEDGSPECKDCDVSKREYTDGLGSTQCRICSEERSYSTGTECKINTEIRDGGSAGKCDIVFLESQLDGCKNANKPFCKQVMTALFVPSPLNATEITGCGEVCTDIVGVQDGVNVLYVINLIDMILEICGLIFVSISAYKYFTTLNTHATSSSSKITVHIMWFFAITDFILQVIALSIAGSIQTSMSEFQAANCLDVTNIEGLKKHDILTELSSSVALTLLLGGVEIVLTITEMGCSTGGLKICSSKQDIVVRYVTV